jgi:hypothetical protein
MWVWIVLAGLFLLLLGTSLNEALSRTSSRSAAFLGAAADGIATIAAAVGVFGLLMALFLGLFSTSGVRLSGDSLRGVLLWSAGAIALAAVLFFAGSGARRLGDRAGPPRPQGGGH